MSFSWSERDEVIMTEAGTSAKVPFPLIFWGSEIDLDASDWLRHAMLRRGVSSSTAVEYANILRPFLRHCRIKHVDWKEADDLFLVTWAGLLQGAGSGANRANTCLSIIFQFYLWAEQNGRIRYRVGAYDELPEAMGGYIFPISAERTRANKWTTPLRVAGGFQSWGNRHTPTNAQVEQIHLALLTKRNGLRDSLIASWAEEVGLRRFEILSLDTGQFPSREEIRRLRRMDEPFLIEVKRKRGYVTKVAVPLDLLDGTLDYIQGDRGEVARDLRRLGKGISTSLFLSSRTGQSLRTLSVTRILKDAFVAAGIRKANIHRLRAKFAQDVLETFVDAMMGDKMLEPSSSLAETILTRVSQLMAHMSPLSLRPYLNQVLYRRLQTSDASRVRDLAVSLRLLTRQREAMYDQLAAFRPLVEIGRLIENGHEIKAAAALTKLADRVRQGEVSLA